MGPKRRGGLVWLTALVFALFTSACLRQSAGIEVEVLIAPFESHRDAGQGPSPFGTVDVTGIEFIPCTSSQTSGHVHHATSSFALSLEDQPVLHTASLAPGAYCTVHVNVTMRGGPTREAIRRIGCDAGREPMVLDTQRRHAALAITFPASFESELDPEGQALDAFVRGLEVERTDCAAPIQP